MGKCRNCNIEILDNTDHCPLCHSVLEQTEELENMYPNVQSRMHVFNILTRIYLFCALLVEAILVIINYMQPEPEIWWSVITGLVFLYVYVMLRYAILGKSGYKSKVLLLTSIAILSAVAIDLVTGYRGWSLDYVLPVGIVIVDVIIIACMLVNRRNWQSYIMWQILMILCSFLPIFFYYSELEKNEYLVFLPMAFSVTLFLGTMIIGDRRAYMELKRRFHIN